jgi:hypothetical protein
VADIELVDLEVIARYSLAIRQESAAAEDVLAALDESRAFVLAILDGAGVEEAHRRARSALQSADVEDVVVEEDEEEEEEEEEEEGVGDAPEDDDDASWVDGLDEWADTDEDDIAPDDSAPATGAAVEIDAPRAAEAAPPRRSLLRRRAPADSPDDDDSTAPLSAEEAAERRAARRARREGRARA